MTGMAGTALNGIALWLTRRERREERDDDTLRALLTALNTTKRYIARLHRGEGDDYELEAELVDLWQEAAVRIRRSDPDLARRLQTKAEYWTNPRHWSADDVRENEILIDRVGADIHRMLANV